MNLRALLRQLSLALNLCALPTFAAERPRVIVLPVAASDPKLKSLADAVAEQVLTELGETRRIDTLGSSDLGSMLGLERQKQLLGCSDQSNSCLAEMTSAMGAPWVVAGSLARAGKTMRVDLKLIRARDGKAVWRTGKNFKDESELFGLVTAMVKVLIGEIRPPSLEELAASPPAAVEVTPALEPSVPAVSAAAAPVVSAQARAPMRVAPLVAAGSGLVAVVVGATLAAATWSNQRALAAPGHDWTGFTTQQVAQQEAGANAKIVGGTVAASVGTAVLVGGLLWWALGRPADAVRVSFVPGTNSVLVGAQF